MTNRKNWILGIMFVVGLLTTLHQAQADSDTCQPEVYTVQKGDTFLGILLSQKGKTHAHVRIFGSHGALNKMANMNKGTINDIDLIFPGQEIKIPAELSSCSTATGSTSESAPVADAQINADTPAGQDPAAQAPAAAATGTGAGNVAAPTQDPQARNPQSQDAPTPGAAPANQPVQPAAQVEPQVQQGGEDQLVTPPVQDPSAPLTPQ